MTDIDVPVTHLCDIFHFRKNAYDALAFDSLPELELSLRAQNNHMALLYIAGYVCRRNKEDPEDTFVYFEKYGRYNGTFSRGKFNIPADSIYWDHDT